MSNQVFKNSNERYTMQVGRANEFKIFDTDPTIDPSCQLHIQDEGNSCLVIEGDYENDGTGQAFLDLESRGKTEGMALITSTISGSTIIVTGNSVDKFQGEVIFETDVKNSGQVGFQGVGVDLAKINFGGCNMRHYKPLTFTEEYTEITFEKTADIGNVFIPWEVATVVNAGDPLYMPTLSGVSPNQVLAFPEEGIYHISVQMVVNNNITTSILGARLFNGLQESLEGYGETPQDGGQIISGLLHIKSGALLANWRLDVRDLGAIVGKALISSSRLIITRIR